MDILTNAVGSPGDVELPFEEIYRRHAAQIYRFCLLQLRNAAAAEDAAADVFVSALRAYDRAPRGEGTRFWLLRIARNAVISHHRREARRQRLLQLARGGRRLAEDVDDIFAVREEVRRVSAVVAHMRERDRLFIGLRVAAQMSYDEIGEFVGISEDAAKMGTHRALKALRERLGHGS